MLDSLKSAFISIGSNKVRSLLTVLGVIIGVSSVTILVGLGEGLKKDVSSLIEGFGTNFITVIAGKIDTSAQNAQTNPANFISGDILTLQDVESIQKLENITAVSPIGLVAGELKRGEKVIGQAMFGAYPNFLDVIEVLKIDQGQFFSSAESGKEIVLSANGAKALFGDQNPVGKMVFVGKEEFQVIGTFQEVGNSSIFANEYGNLSIIPFGQASALNKGRVMVSRIGAKANGAANVKEVKQKIHDVLLANHGEENFSVLTQDDILGLFDQFLSLATAMVSAIAAISLVVGGIGIMNIMLVTVTERTREIGLRKAVGATKRAILIQFLIEAVIVTLLGGLLGLAIAFLIGQIIAANTPLQPVFSLQVIATAVSLSVVIGVIFGLWPAMRAARKDPIEALRYE